MSPSIVSPVNELRLSIKKFKNSTLLKPINSAAYWILTESDDLKSFESVSIWIVTDFISEPSLETLRATLLFLLYAKTPIPAAPQTPMIIPTVTKKLAVGFVSVNFT